MQMLSYIVFGTALSAIVAMVNPAAGDLALRGTGFVAVIVAAWELRK